MKSISTTQNKICPICNEIKLLSSFNKCSKAADGSSGYCKSCVNNQNERRRIKNFNRAQQIKTNSGCIHCGEIRPYLLMFHHPNPSQKSFGIGSRMGNNWNKILLEIQKCQILCHNCHAATHWRKRHGIPAFEEQIAVYEATLASV